MHRVILLIGVHVLLLAATPFCVAAEVKPAAVLLAGPLPAIEPVMATHEAVRTAKFTSELAPPLLWPVESDVFAWAPGHSGQWSVRPLTDGDLPLGDGGSAVSWIAFYATVDRQTEVSIRVGGGGDLRLFVDGEEADHAGAVGDEATSVEAKETLRRGLHRVLLRVAGHQDGTSLSIALEAEDEDARVETGLDPRHSITEYDELRDMNSASGLSLSPDGELLALRLRQPNPVDDSSRSRLDIVELSTGVALAASLGGSGARAVAWRPDSQVLLYREGTSLFIWHRADGHVVEVLHEESGLGPVSWSKDGTFIVFSSTTGVEEDKSKIRRRIELREKLTDWPTEPHLHLLMLASGARRRLSMPGDWSQDSFEILPDNRTLLYLRNHPADERPWFATEFRSLDLVEGGDRLVARVNMGFENRPGLSGLAVSPDGSKVAFIGPPSELGEKDAVEPSAFDPDLFIMNLENGEWYRVTEDLSASVSGHLRWVEDSTSILFTGTDGSRHRLIQALLPPSESPVVFMETAVGGDRIHDISIVAHGRVPAYAAVASDPDRLPALYVRVGAGKLEPRLFMELNPDLSARWKLATPVNASFDGPDGSRIEGWLYRPEQSTPLAPGEKIPLIVYYYGGATPTIRGFNSFHQFLVGHGYALFALNPRGAHGYGQPFADQHVAEWGERAGADVIAGVEHLLAANDDLDPERIGCYGGSYGGFMTMWLVSHSDLFAAAVSMYGISNLASYFGEGMWGYTYGDQAINRYPWSDSQFFIDHSPVFAADRIHTPLLLLHGEVDVNVPVSESEQMFTALRLLDRPVELVRFPKEDHGIGGTWENRSSHRMMLLEWFDRYLKDQPMAWEARWK